MKVNQQLGKLISLFLIPSLLMVFWQALHFIKGDGNSYVVSPLETVVHIWEHKQRLIDNAIFSVRRLFSGVLVGVILGTFSGILIARKKMLTLMFSPTLNVLTSIPIIVLIPFFFIFFGFGELFRVALVSSVVFFIIYQTMFGIVKHFPKEFLDYAAHRKKSNLEVISNLYLPSAIPELVKSIRLSLLFGWLAVALAEKAVAKHPYGGLGHQILRAREQGFYEELFAAVLVLAVIAALLDSFMKFLQVKSSRWMDIKVEE